MFYRHFSRRNRRLYLSLFACLVATFAVIPAYATIMRYLEVEDLTRASSDIFHGQVVSTDTYWNAERTRIYTRVIVRVDEPLKGETRRSDMVTVTQLGGERDGIRMDYAGRPTFATGEDVVLFTTRGRNRDFIVVGLKQGKMRVQGSELLREFSGITFIDRTQTNTSRIKMNDLRTRIARTR